MMKARNAIERAMQALFFCCGIVSIAAVALITVYMIISGLPAIREIGAVDFLFGQVWKSTAKEPLFGILPFILTSVYGTLGAILIGVPIGLMMAVFLSKLAGRGSRRLSVRRSSCWRASPRLSMALSE